MSAEFYACLLLALVALILGGWFIRHLLQPPYPPFHWIFYDVSMLITRLQWRCIVTRGLPIEEGKGAVIVTNHRTSVDPFFLQTAVGSRRVHWMVAKEYVQHAAFSWFLVPAQVIPTNRAGIDTAATKQAIRYAKQGSLVGMLPEGRINMSEDFLLPIRPGAALIALRARVPIIPCYIEGAPYGGFAYSPFLKRARVRVHCGDPIDLSAWYEQENEQEVAAKIILQAMTEVARLAGDNEFRPTLAGRRWKPTQEELQTAIEAQDGGRSRKAT